MTGKTFLTNQAFLEIKTEAGPGLWSQNSKLDHSTENWGSAKLPPACLYSWLIIPWTVVVPPIFLAKSEKDQQNPSSKVYSDISIYQKYKLYWESCGVLGSKAKTLIIIFYLKLYCRDEIPGNKDCVGWTKF